MRGVLALSAFLAVACTGCGEIAFLNGGALVFASAAGIPILLHLLFRRRPRVIPFPPIRFIQRSKRATARRFRLKHLILLFLRMLMIVLFVLIVSKPYVKSRQRTVQGKARVRAALVFDDSFSMGYLDRKASRLDQAKRLALQVLDSFEVGSEVAFLTTSDASGRFTLDIEKVRQQIGDVSPTARADSCWPAVQRADSLFGSDLTLPREAYVFTDLTKNAWQTAEKVKTTPDVNWCIVDVSAAKDENNAVTGALAAHRTLPVHTPTHVATTVQGKGAERQVVALFVDGEKRNQQEVRLENGTATCRFNYSPRQDGLHFGRVSLVGEDPLVVDNTRHFLFDVRPPAGVLCVCESAAEAFFLTHALRPEEDPTRQRVRPVCISPGELAAKDLRDFQAVFLLNVKRLDANQAAMLTGYVSGGGGVVIFAGSQTDLKDFAPADSGMAPAGKMELAVEDKPIALQPGDYTHPILQSFRGGLNGDLASPHFTRHLKPAQAAEARQSRTILQFSDGSPALIEGSVGAGKVLFFAGSIAASDVETEMWTNLPKTPCFVPFLHEMLAYVSHYAEGPKDVEVGETVSIRAPASSGERLVEVALPGKGRTVRVPVDRETSLALFRETREPGGYAVTISTREKKEQRGFVVNVSPKESNLTKATDAQIAAAMPNAAVRFARTTEDVRKVERELRIGRDLSAALLWPLLLLMLMEPILGNTFYRDSS